MNFFQKINITFFILSFSLVGTICIVIYFYLSRYIEKDLRSNYQSELGVLAQTLQEFERATEIIAINALNYLKLKDKQSGTPSNDELTKLKNELSISHFYITNASGDFIRSTNGPILANIFNYCKDYQNLIKSNSEIFVTPIVPSSDEPTVGYYKYLMIPNYNRTRILEASISFDFIGKLLHTSLESMQDLLSISLYTPTGVLLGSVKKNNIDDKKKNFKTIEIIKIFNGDRQDCCECNIKGISANGGKFYYKLIAKISTLRIENNINYLMYALLIIFLIFGIICIFVSRIIARKLVSRFNKLHNRINNLLVDGQTKKKLNIPGSDEIADISRRFDELILKFKDTQKKLLASEKDKAITIISSQVAHDIRSPITAINTALATLTTIPENIRTMVRNASNRINDIANNLLIISKSNNSENTTIPDLNLNQPELIFIIVDNIITEKRYEYNHANIEIKFNLYNNIYNCFSNLNQTAFKRVLSNLINNSFEAIPLEGTITINLKCNIKFIEINLEDTGCGIPNNVLPNVIKKDFSFNKKNEMD